MAIKDNPNKRSPPWALGQVYNACNGNMVLTGLVIVLIIANVNLMGGIYNKRSAGGQQEAEPQPLRLQTAPPAEKEQTESSGGAKPAGVDGGKSMGLPVPKPWPYTCWEPKSGLTKPVVTIVTIAGGLDEHHPFLRRNRLHYAAAQGYRYCELAVIDTTRVGAWTKMPWMLALLPCTDFMYHADADALFINHTLSLEPWTQYMETQSVDQLLSSDIIRESPINFGVFFVHRGGGWLYSFWQNLYNRCPCAWGSTHDWPAEQGMLYDLLVEKPSDTPARRTAIVPGKDWNDVNPGWGISHTRVVSHLTYPPHPSDDAQCIKEPASRPCKYKGVQYFWKRGLEDGAIQPYELQRPEDLMVEGKNTCRDVVYKQLVDPVETYSGNGRSASIMDVVVDRNGELHGVHVSQIACTGFRENKCGLKQYWNRDKGTGPMMPLKEGQVSFPERSRPWSPPPGWAAQKQREAAQGKAGARR